MSEDLPVVSDTIVIRFVLDGGRRVWWPCTVDHVQVEETKSDTIAWGSVMYEARFGYPQERGLVYFREGSRLSLLEAGELKVSTWMYAAALEEDDTMADAATPSGRTPKRKKLNWKPEEKMATRSATKEENCRELLTSQSCEERTVRRLDALERRVADMAICTHRPVIQERVDAVLLHLKFALLRTMQRPLRFQRKPDECGIGTAVQRSAVWVDVPVDFNLFQYLTTHVSETFDGRDSTAVVFTPGRKDIMYPSGSPADYQISFLKAAAFFDYLGIVNDTDVKNLVYRSQQWRSGRMVRILGGMRWDEEDLSGQVDIFVAASCAKMKPAGTIDVDDVLLTKTVTYETGLWDEENNLSRSRPVCAKAEQGPLHTNALEECCFSLRWTWERTPPAGMFSSHTTRNGGIQLGRLTAFLPCVLVCGESACSDITRVLTTTSLTEFIE